MAAEQPPSYVIGIPLTADEVSDYINTNNKQTVEYGSPNYQIDIVACAYQNVSDSVHDGLKESAAQAALPPGFDNITHQTEDEHMAAYLYNLSDRNRPNTATLEPHMQNYYESYFRIPLFNGGYKNIDANGTPTYTHRVSVVETMLDSIGVKSPNVFLSYDFGFPELKYDIGFSKNRQFYVGYRPCQENDAAGKPTLSSSNAPGFGLLSTQAPVEFIWTNPAIEPFFTYLPRYTTHINSVASENYAVSRFDMYIGWDRNIWDKIRDKVQDENEADLLKSATIFHDPVTREFLPSNSDWTSKSGKDQIQYQKYHNEMISIQKKGTIELLLPKTIIEGHKIQEKHFEILHALAKNSGDKLTAITYPNSYTPRMLASVMFYMGYYTNAEILRTLYYIQQNKHLPIQDDENASTDIINIPLDISEKSFIAYISRSLSNNPEIAGEIAEQIDKDLSKNPGYLDNIANAMGNPLGSRNTVTDIIDLITNRSGAEINTRETLRREPRLFRKLKNKSEPIYDKNNYTYMWLDDYVFVYVTHDRLAAACALERLVDIVILESPRKDDKSVFSLFVRKDTKDPVAMLEKNIENMLSKIGTLKSYIIQNEDGSIAVNVNNDNDVNGFLSVFGITKSPQPYIYLTEINGKFESLGAHIEANHREVIHFTYNLDYNDLTNNDIILKLNIVNGLISNTFYQIEASYRKLYASFSQIIGNIPLDARITDARITDARITDATIEQHITNVISYFIEPLIGSIQDAQGLQQMDTPKKQTWFAYANKLFYKAKEYLQIYTSFQELSDKLTILSQIQQIDLKNYQQLLGILSGFDGQLQKLLNEKTKTAIANLGPRKYIKDNTSVSRASRVSTNWFTSSKTSLKRAIETDLPNSFGLTQLFWKLIPMMNPRHVIEIFNYYKTNGIPLMDSIITPDRNVKTDFIMTRNCLNAILSDFLTNAAGNQIGIDEQGNLILVDAQGNPILVDAEGNQIFDVEGNPIAYNQGNPILVDEHGNSIVFDAKRNHIANINFIKIVVEKLVEKLAYWGESFDLITGEEKSMFKKLEKAAKTVTKVLSKKKQLMQQTKEDQISERIKDMVNRLIQRPVPEAVVPSSAVSSAAVSSAAASSTAASSSSSASTAQPDTSKNPTSFMRKLFNIGIKKGGKTVNKYKSRKSGKTTRKYHKSGGRTIVNTTYDSDTIIPRIIFFYRCITMYILYLTNVIELYTNLRNSKNIDGQHITKLNKKIDRITIMRDEIVKIVERLSINNGNNLSQMSRKKPYAPLEIEQSIKYFEDSAKMETEPGQAPEPPIHQITEILTDSFYLQLVNVNTYLSKLEVLPEPDQVNPNADLAVNEMDAEDSDAAPVEIVSASLNRNNLTINLLAELDEILDTIHDEIIEYVFVNDNDEKISSGNTLIKIDANRKILFDDLFASFQPSTVTPERYSFNFGYNEALIRMLVQNQKYYKSNHDIYGDNGSAQIDGLIRKDLTQVLRERISDMPFEIKNKPIVFTKQCANIYILESHTIPIIINYAERYEYKREQDAYELKPNNSAIVEANRVAYESAAKAAKREADESAAEAAKREAAERAAAEIEAAEIEADEIEAEGDEIEAEGDEIETAAMIHYDDSRSDVTTLPDESQYKILTQQSINHTPMRSNYYGVPASGKTDKESPNTIIKSPLKPLPKYNRWLASPRNNTGVPFGSPINRALFNDMGDPYVRQEPKYRISNTPDEYILSESDNDDRYEEYIQDAVDNIGPPHPMVRQDSKRPHTIITPEYINGSDDKASQESKKPKENIDGGKSNKTQKLRNTKKHTHLRKTHKNTKRAKYIKKNVTKRRR
jgi:hypothetical protein